MAFLDWIPIIGDVLDFGFGLTDKDAVGRTNANNLKIAEMNRDMQRETNEINRQNVLDTNAQNASIAQHYNANQVKLQNDMNYFNERMWEKNNAYNSPSAQLARASAAGINPNIVFGQPVASSPVQQTSAPSQQMAHMLPYSAESPKLDMRYQARQMKKIGDILRGVQQLPFVKEELNLKKEQVKAARLENDVREYDKWEREEEKKQYGNFGFIRSRDGQILISPDEYYSMSDKDKEKFLSPLSYRHNISDKRISLDEYNALNDDNKKLYSADFGDINNRLPDITKGAFKSKRQFENFKSLYSVGSTLKNISADRLQNELRYKVLSGQLNNDDAVNAMCFMPVYEFKKLVAEYSKVIEDVKSAKEHNKGLAARLATEDKMANYAAKQMENNGDKDVIGIIKKHVPEGVFRDFLISAYAILSQANGGVLDWYKAFNSNKK